MRTNLKCDLVSFSIAIKNNGYFPAAKLNFNKIRFVANFSSFISVLWFLARIS